MNSHLAIALLGLVGCASAKPSSSAPSLPLRSAATRTDIMMLMAESLAREFCLRVEGRFLPLSQSGVEGPQAGELAVTGRWWIRECAAELRGGFIGLRLGGPGWQWVDRTESDHRIRQYVYFHATTTSWGIVDATYAAAPHVLSLWFSPVAPPGVEATGIGPVAAKSQGVLGTAIDMFDVITLGLLVDVDGRTKQKINDEAVSRFREQLGRGFTVTYDLGLKQLDVSLQAMPAGMTPLRPFKDGRAWLAHERQEVHDASGAFHVVGPFDPAIGVDIDFDVEAGPGLDYRAECVSDVVQWFANVENGTSPHPPVSQNGQDGRAAPGVSVRRIVMPWCRWYLVTGTQGGDVRAAVRVRANSVTLLTPQ